MEVSKAFAMTRAAAKAPSARARCATAKHERLASYPWLCAIQNSFEVSTGAGLEKWSPKERAWDDDEKPGETEPGVCCGLFDQEQVQWCAAWFLTYKLRGQFY